MKKSVLLLAFAFSSFAFADSPSLVDQYQITKVSQSSRASVRVLEDLVSNDLSRQFDNFSFVQNLKYVEPNSTPLFAANILKLVNGRINENFQLDLTRTPAQAEVDQYMFVTNYQELGCRFVQNSGNFEKAFAILTSTIDPQSAKSDLVLQTKTVLLRQALAKVYQECRELARSKSPRDIEIVALSISDGGDANIDTLVVVDGVNKEISMVGFGANP